VEIKNKTKPAGNANKIFHSSVFCESTAF